MRAIPDDKIQRAEVEPPFGLAFTPTLGPWLSDDARDAPGGHAFQSSCGHDNSLAVLDCLRGLTAGAERILEIGVSLYAPDRSFTPILARPGYLGVDIHPRAVPTGRFLHCDSKNFARVLSELSRHQLLPLDLLVIDGDHSVRGCLADWEYARLVRPGGQVVLHDSNSHPGPIAVVAAVDRTIFTVDEPFLGQKDFGLAICTRLR